MALELFGHILICESPDNTVTTKVPPGKLWLKPSTGEIFRDDNGWQKVAITFKNIVLDGVIVDSLPGITRSIPLTGGVLHIHDGIITGWTPT